MVVHEADLVSFPCDVGLWPPIGSVYVPQLPRRSISHIRIKLMQTLSPFAMGVCNKITQLSN